MEIVVILIVSITVLIKYHILTLILLGIIIKNTIKRNWHAMARNVFAYLLSVALVIGIPYGFSKTVIPEAEGAEQAIMKEVQEWIS